MGFTRSQIQQIPNSTALDRGRGGGVTHLATPKIGVGLSGVSNTTRKLPMRVWVMHRCKNGGMSKSMGHVCLSNGGGGGVGGEVCD